MRRGPALVLALAAALIALIALIGACSGDPCAKEPAGFELDLTVAADVDVARIKGLTLVLLQGSDRWRRSYTIASELADRETSVAVRVEPAPAAPFMLELHVSAVTTAGEVVAESSGRFLARPDGCNRFGLELGPGGGVGAPDAGGGGPDAGFVPPPDAGVVPPADSGVVPDSGVVIPEDAGATQPACAAAADPDTLGLYTFDSDPTPAVLLDSAGGHHGAIAGNGASRVPGKQGCGSALGFPSSSAATSYGVIPPAPAWMLASGSFDLWLRAPAAGHTRAFGVVSRDTRNEGPTGSGHVTLYLACDNTVVVKLEPARGPTVYLCSDAPVPGEAWSHAGVSFGPPGLELWVNGARATRTGDVGLFGGDCEDTVRCGGSTTEGIGGNDLPWLLGASGETGEADRPFRSGAIDSFRISRVRRAF